MNFFVNVYCMDKICQVLCIYMCTELVSNALGTGTHENNLISYIPNYI